MYVILSVSGGIFKIMFWIGKMFGTDEMNTNIFVESSGSTVFNLSAQYTVTEYRPPPYFSLTVILAYPFFKPVIFPLEVQEMTPGFSDVHSNKL